MASLSVKWAPVDGDVRAYRIYKDGVLVSEVGPTVTSATVALFGWAVDLLRGVLPGWTLFPVGVAVLLAGFALFDRVLPSVGSERLEHRRDVGPRSEELEPVAGARSQHHASGAPAEGSSSTRTTRPPRSRSRSSAASAR